MKENNFLAITYIMLGMTAFALQDTVIRLLAVDISILQVMFARSVVALILLTLFLKITKKEIILKTEFPKLSIFRTVMFILAFVFYYIGLHYLTFAEATALFFTAPFFITIFSGIFLRSQADATIRPFMTRDFSAELEETEEEESVLFFEGCF